MVAPVLLTLAAIVPIPRNSPPAKFIKLLLAIPPPASTVLPAVCENAPINERAVLRADGADVRKRDRAP
jgi:hypothetical protein